MKRIIYKDSEFIVFINYLIIFLNSGYNLYQAISETEKLFNNKIKEIIVELNGQIKKDKSIRPYQIFSEKFNNLLINQIMSLIYQNNKSGKINNFEQLIPILERLKMQVIDDRIKKEQQILNNFLLAPVFGAIIVSVYFSSGILTILLGNIYG